MASRTLPGLGLTGFWDLGAAGWKPGMDANILILSVLAKAVVISRTTSLPGSPSNGDIYIVPEADTDGDKIAYRDNAAWGYITPWEGLQMWVNDEDGFVTFDGADWAAGTAGALSDAPSDGTLYGRKDAVWVAVPSGGNSRTVSAKTADYTLEAGDVDAKINIGHASTPLTLTAPQNSVAAIPVGGWLPVENTGVADVTIEAGSGATLVNGPLTLLTGEVALLWKNSTNGWTVSKLGGSGGSAEYPDFAGNAGKHLAVNAEEDDVEWVDPGTGGILYLNISFFAGGTPTASEIVARYIAVEAFDIASGATGSYGKLATAPSGGSVVFDIQHNGSSIGSLTFSSGSTTGSFSIGSLTSFDPGDTLDFIAPSNLRSCEDLSVSVLGSL